MSDFNNHEFEENNQGNTNIMETLLRDFLPYWPVIFAAAIIGFISSKVYLKYQRPVHQVEAGILLKDESQSTDNLLKQAIGGQAQTPIEDELEILKGTNVMRRAAKLANAFYTIEWAGQFNNYYDHINTQPFDLEFLNFRVTFITSDRAITTIITNNKTNILQFLGMVGGISWMDKRNNILVIRQIDSKREILRVNLTDASIFNSPAYYLQPNDIIYVEPNKRKFLETNIQLLSYVTTIASTVSILVLFINSLSK